MELPEVSVVVISHAGIKQINRAVYRHFKDKVKHLAVVIPAQLQLGSGQIIAGEPPLPGDPHLLPLALRGRNPRTYFYPDLILRLNELRPDVVLLENDPVSRLGLQLTRWCKRNNAKLICQTYENLKRDLKSTRKARGLRAVPINQLISMLNVWMTFKVDAILVVNKDSEAIFTNFGYRNVTRLPLGYDKNVFFPNAEMRAHYRQKLGVTNETSVIAYFGRLVKQKGVHLLIQALAALKSLDWILLLDHIHDSEDDYIRCIQKLIRDHRLDGRVIYFEADHFEIANYMRASDIMVAPSVTTPAFKEQYGRAVQEAMACGCVCVVSDSGHLKDLVGDDEFVFREGNVAMLASRLKNLLENKDGWAESQAFLMNRAAGMLTTDVQAARLESLIKELLE